ncbi:ribose 5-phosphate isomerase B [Geopsychrobacter electrodiphilus]|uniref:ribose 5-phosphate isomerase B n=1 Tax=Geopsychrobacter electrodiphilus TaxID=225196 RepID=UPI00037783D1|nr:ribose 5-phosphate isomerase B [Geopsychrobacter electrodiphilus]
MIAVGSDHGGLDLKNAVCALLITRGLAFSDMGTVDTNSVDYPDFGFRVASAVAGGGYTEGILICGTGIGMSIAANKVNGIRAALVHDPFTAQMAKQHNNANVLVMGGRVLTCEQGCELVEIWLDTLFEGGRHQSRLEKIQQIELDQK